MKLPNQRDIVLSDIFIGTDEGHLLVKGGCDKKAVKRITMKQRQSFINGKVRRFNREKDKTVGFSVSKKISRISVNVQFPNVQFNCNFPSGNNTQIYLVGKRKDYIFGGFGKGIIAAEIPNRRMCIKRGTFALWARLRFKKVMPHLHIILQVLKRCVKILRHAVLPFRAAKTASFTAFRGFFREINYFSPPRWYFGRHVNNQPVVYRDFYSLRNTHKEKYSMKNPLKSSTASSGVDEKKQYSESPQKSHCNNKSKLALASVRAKKQGEE
jgi:hypothetical protein